MTALVWYRNNLRTIDSSPLLAACDRFEEVHACFLFSTPQWQNHGWGPNRIEYTRKIVVALAEELRELNIPLHSVYTPTFEKAPGIIRAFAQELGCSEVHWSREYEMNEMIRDRETRDLLERNHIAVVEHDDDVVVPPDSLSTKSNKPFRVFTPFKRAWLTALDDRLSSTARVRPRPRKVGPATFPEIPEVVPGCENFAPQEDFPIGAVQAVERLDSFIEQTVEGYADNRDIPSIDGTSGLSPCLATGAISPRTCVQAAREELRKNPKKAPGLEVWISEIAWRDFYRSIVFHYPHVCRGEPFKPDTKSIPWRADEKAFEAWCMGQTGYPIVDAAMRALVKTGWMHNRLRMVTAQFLTKHLLIDWRRGEEFFAHHLIDIDFASNNGGWQWSASTGTDAAPYFRVFNPTTQGRRFDPNGDFIRRFVPEIAHLGPKEIHQPELLTGESDCASDYPAPIVEQSHGRQRAIATFASVAKQLSETSS